jgi:hypothetical protein
LIYIISYFLDFVKQKKNIKEEEEEEKEEAK